VIDWQSYGLRAVGGGFNELLEILPQVKVSGAVRVRAIIYQVE
jgi:hypothetical protein